MGTDATDDATIARLLAMRTWAVVGWSPRASRDSHRIAALLEARGKHVLRVNPRAPEALPDLAAAGPVDVVDIFRRADEAGAHVDEAIALGARAVWLQLGVVDEEAAQRARAAGPDVVMDRCPAIEWPRLDAATQNRLG